MPTPPRPRRAPGPSPGHRPRPRPRSQARPRPVVRTTGWRTRVATTLSVLVLSTGGIGHAVVTSLDTGIGRVDPFKDMKNRPEAGHGMNLLVVGTDGRDKITPEDKRAYRLGGAPCRCADTIMLVHISADRERASVVSLPRDSYAQIPEHTDVRTGERHKAHPLKLNGAYSEGGPQLTVRTVEQLTKVKIDHYLEVDFTTFMKTVDTLGGVEICTARPLKDTRTGLDLGAGTHRLNGGQALQYVRSRHVDGAGDLGRMRRQQRFLAALIHQGAQGGALLNPVKFRNATGTMLDSVRADKGFGAAELVALGRAMRGFSAASSEFTSVPVGDSSVIVKGIGSTVKWDEAKAGKLFRMLREDKPLTAAPSGPVPVPAPAQPSTALVDVEPRRIRVQIYNGTHTDGLGRRMDDALRAIGFNTTRAPLNGESREVRRTYVLYDPRWDRSARSLAAALPGSKLRKSKGQGPTLKVVAGRDFKAATPVRAEEPARGEYGAVKGDQVVCP